jgi:hypothetical protein
VKSKNVVRIDFADFSPGLDKTNNFFFNLLSRRYRVEISDDPDLMLYSNFGSAHSSFACKRIFVSFENRGWGFAECDFAITSDLIQHPDHYRFPFYAVHMEDPFVQPEVNSRRCLESKQGFASVVVSNPTGDTRNRFQDRLNEHREVASGGRFRNNVGQPIANKLEFISRYKFNLAFENSKYPGYTTEKLYEALQADTIPIYWGSETVGTDFNPKRIVNYSDFPSEEAMVRRIIELDQDDDAYCEVLEEPWFPGGAAPRCTDRGLLLNWLERVIADERTPVAQQRSLRLSGRRLRDRWRTRQRRRNRAT